MSLTDRWKLGNKSKELIRQATKRHISVSAKQLASKLGQRNDANLRQAIKFAGRATELQASALQRADIPWRGVVYWLGVESAKDFQDLRRQMLGGLTNSTEIRKRIADQFKKRIDPRKKLDLADMAKKALEKGKVLNATLDAFGDVCQRSDNSVSAKDRRRTGSELQRLDKALEQTSVLIRSTRVKIKRRR